jgi:uncharacterized phiE125 gp8 family phage protein
MYLSESYSNKKAYFNAVLDCRFSDQGPSSSGGAQVLNLTGTTQSFVVSDLVNAVIYLLFVDGISYAYVQTFSNPVLKEFTFDASTGTITLSIAPSGPLPVTIFYTSPGTESLPTVEPVTLAEVKAYAKIDTGTDDDSIITDLITAAREQCEDFTGISIVNRTVTAVLNNGCGGIYLPYCPFINLFSILDDDGNVISTDDYKLSGILFPQLIYPHCKVTVMYTAGYGLPPQRIKTAILQQTFYLYENRGESAVISRSGIVAELTLSPQAKATLQRFRRVG